MAVTAVEISQAADPTAFGGRLRAQREARHLTVQQIADSTKIASHHFSSLERGDIRQWPTGMYRRAMVRAYARAIGLDPEETVRTFVRVYSEQQDGSAVGSGRPAHRNAATATGTRRTALTAFFG